MTDYSLPPIPAGCFNTQIAASLGEHYKRVARFQPRCVYLFERARPNADEASKNIVAVKRAWDRLAASDLAIRVYPPVPNKDMYFVNINEARPNLAPQDCGESSFLRAMRRAGLMRPPRSDYAVHDLWTRYLEELCVLIGIAPVTGAAPALVTVPATPPCFIALLPLVLDTTVPDSPVLFPSAMEPGLLSEGETSFDVDSPPAPDGDQLPIPVEEFVAAPAPPASGEWSNDDLSALLSDTSSEELVRLNDICRELIVDPYH